MTRCYMCMKVNPRLAFVDMVIATAPNLKRRVKRPLCPDCKKVHEELYTH